MQQLLWEGDKRNITSCICSELKEFKPIILSVTFPVIFCYASLIMIGASNVYRFIRVKSMSRNLAMIYFWSLLSNISWGIFLAFCMQNNMYQYLPYVTGVYAKILVGIAYQASIFDLKYVVKFYFQTNQDFGEATF